MKEEVIQGDCLEIMKDIPDKSIDMILADLPYGTTACKWDTIIPLEPLWEQYNRIIKDNGAIVLTASQPFTSALVMSNVKMFKYCWTWDKITAKGHLVAKIRPMQQTEDILVFGIGKINYYPQMTLREKETTNKETKRTEIMGGNTTSFIGKYTQKYPKTILRFSSDKQRINLHPTQKPVALFEYLIKTYTNEGDLVLDNCAGSGTTGVACKNLKRNFILIEKEQEYIDIINKRLTAPSEKARGGNINK